MCVPNRLSFMSFDFLSVLLQQQEDDEDEEDFQTQGFDFRDSDSDDQLWEVEYIKSERKDGTEFLVKWAGVDDNGKPWKDSWVPREDVTDDLVQDWRQKQAAEKKQKEKKRKGRLSIRKKTDSKCALL